MGFIDKLFGKNTVPEKSQDVLLAQEALSWYNKGVEANASGKHQQAFEYFEKAVANCEVAIEMNPKNPEAYFWKGVCIGELGQLEAQQKGRLTRLEWGPARSAEAFQKFLEIAPPGYNPKMMEIAKEIGSYRF
jgi:tetratricopeptide (TPR) repeat protein